MSVQTWSANPYLFSMSVGDQTYDGIAGLAQFQLQWQRPLRYVKYLDDGAPYLTYGSSQGNIQVQGLATDAITARGGTSRAIWNGINPNPTSPTVITIGLKKNATGSEKETKYTAYNTGDGFTFRQVSERFWVLDGTQSFQFID